jgi:hypothetical protein
MNRLLFSIILIQILSSCSISTPPQELNEPEDPIGKKICEDFQASAFGIDYQNSITTNGTVNTIELTLTNIQPLTYKVNIKDMTSGIALELFNMMSDSLRKIYRNYKINIKGANYSYSESFAYDDLAFPSLLSKDIDGFARWLDDTSCCHVFDGRYIPDSSATSLQRHMSNALPGNGKPSFQIVSCGWKSIENLNEPIVTYGVVVSRGTNHIELGFYISTKTDAIVYCSTL